MRGLLPLLIPLALAAAAPAPLPERASELRNLGWVEGSVAWKQDDRFGIAFVDEIDPALVRAPDASQASSYKPPRYTKTHQVAPVSQQPEDLARFRKI